MEGGVQSAGGARMAECRYDMGGSGLPPRCVRKADCTRAEDKTRQTRPELPCFRGSLL